MGFQVFAASGTFTAKVTGPHKIILISGGGNGGAGNVATGVGYGGGGGAAGNVSVINETLTAGQTVSVVNNAQSVNVAAAGGSVGFGTFITVAGGQGGETSNGGQRGRGGSANGGMGGGRDSTNSAAYGTGVNIWTGEDSPALATLAPYILAVCGGVTGNSISGNGGNGGRGGGGGAGGITSNTTSEGYKGRGGGGAGGFMTMRTGNTIFGAGGTGGAASSVSVTENRTNGSRGVVIVEW